MKEDLGEGSTTEREFAGSSGKFKMEKTYEATGNMGFLE